MTSLKISTTEELLAVLPYQLGYQLADCVAIMMVTDNVIGPIARTDLTDERDVKDAAATVLESLLRVEPQLAMLVGFESVPGESRSLMSALHAGLLRAGVGIIDHVTVRDGRWWGACCRPEESLDGLRPEHVRGHPIADAAAVPAVAEYIAKGSAPLADRAAAGALVQEDPALSGGVADELATLWDEFCRQIDPDNLLDAGDGVDEWEESDDDDDDDDDDLDEAESYARLALLGRVIASISDQSQQVQRVPELWARVLAPPGERGDAFEMSDGELAHLVRSLVNKSWRDALVAWLSPVMFPLDKVDDESNALLLSHVPTGPATTQEASQVALRRLLVLARRVPDVWSHEAAAICTIAACVAWGIGNGSTAGDAVTRALRVDPDYRLARYLGRMIDHQMRPRHAWADVAA
ncbi:hypothetical protein JNB_00565 [Janibacter sp. HTCC2649]|uniref:DUF4192 family protein n=1 Tax=Janibacter sp. HTCC2649 TaxID=313589 RepID=UPI000066ED68|nr:DUF4192 family protein [Janibacter sp. HTCC2649]EAP98615.1 hypothetical protein JNB_00565 [Janibacter sp. HTCC2649]